MGKPTIFVGSSRDDLRAFPEDVRKVMGYALYLAEQGDKHPHAEPLHGFKGGGVLEVVEDYDSDTYRTMYTVRLSEAIYVLHAFQKKATQGIKTPKRHMERVEQRLKAAEEINAQLRAEARERDTKQGSEKEKKGRRR